MGEARPQQGKEAALSSREGSGEVLRPVVQETRPPHTSSQLLAAGQQWGCSPHVTKGREGERVRPGWLGTLGEGGLGPQ